MYFTFRSLFLRNSKKYIFMEKWYQSSSYFILLGLFPQNQTGPLLILLDIFMFSEALLGNSAMTQLICVVPRLHTPMYFLLSQFSLMDPMHISTTLPKVIFNFLSGQKINAYLWCVMQSPFFLTVAGSEGFPLFSLDDL